MLSHKFRLLCGATCGRFCNITWGPACEVRTWTAWTGDSTRWIARAAALLERIDRRDLYRFVGELKLRSHTCDFGRLMREGRAPTARRMCFYESRAAVDGADKTRFHTNEAAVI